MEKYVLLPIPFYLLWCIFCVRYEHLAIRYAHSIGGIHNAALACMSVGFAWYSASILTEEGRWGNLCKTPLPRPWFVSLWIYSKILEWLDTFLLIGRGRQVSELHFYHHMLTPSFVILQTMVDDGRTALFDIGTFLNASAHVVMYAYFAWPSRWARRFVTLLQLSQHICMATSLSLTFVACSTYDEGIHLISLLFYLYMCYAFSAILFR